MPFIFIQAAFLVGEKPTLLPQLSNFIRIAVGSLGAWYNQDRIKYELDRKVLLNPYDVNAIRRDLNRTFDKEVNHEYVLTMAVMNAAAARLLSRSRYEQAVG